MFGFPAADPGPPQPERRGFEVAAHQTDHLLFTLPCLYLYRIKADLICPGHINDQIQLSLRQVLVTFVFLCICHTRRIRRRRHKNKTSAEEK